MFVHLDILLFWGSQTLASIYSVFFPWGGVDLFFCISGYVITGTLLRQLSKNQGPGRLNSTAIPFWIRRAWRILPAAWFWLIVVLGLSVLFNRSGYLGTASGNAIDAAYVVTQLANFHTWACYAVSGTTCGVDQVYWSLSLEEQVYILLPLLLLHVGRRAVILVLIAIVTSQLFLHRPILSFPWFIRTDALALGVLMALFRGHALYKRFEPRCLARPGVGILALVAAVTILGMLSGLGRTISFHTGLIALGSAALVWIASFDKGYTLPGSVVKRLLVYVGSRSYALYLIHVPIYRVTREIWLRLAGLGVTFDGRYTVLFMVTAWVLTFVLAELSFRILENPLRRRGVRIASEWRSREQAKDVVAI